MNTDYRILVLFGLLIAASIVFLSTPRTPIQPLKITTDSPLPVAVVGLDYSTTLEAIRGTRPYRWTIEGTVPAGLSLDSQTGVIKWRPESLGVFRFRVKASDDSRPQQSDTKLFQITVKQESELKITTPSPLPVGVIGRAYTVDLQTEDENPPLKWSVHELFRGFTLNTSTGEISGNPGQPGTYQFGVTVNDKSNQCDSKRFTLAVLEALTIETNARLPNVFPGQTASSVTLTAEGGLAPFTWSSDDLPDGVTLDPEAGKLVFAPINAGEFEFMITVMDGSNKSAPKKFQLTVLDGLGITNEANLPDARRNQAVDIPLNVVGAQGALTWSANGLPAGLNLSIQTGRISGTPTSAGSFSFDVTVMDQSEPIQTANKRFTLKVLGTSILINGRNNPLRWVISIDGQSPPIDPEAEGIAMVDVAPGDTIEWRSESGFHGLTFEAFSEAQAFLEFSSQSLVAFNAQVDFGADARGTEGQAGSPPPANPAVLARATVRQSAASALTFTCTIHGSLETTTMDGRLSR
ncbi:MAG: Ig domain-containing protein [Methylococcales bacterium]